MNFFKTLNKNYIKTSKTIINLTIIGLLLGLIFYLKIDKSETITEIKNIATLLNNPINLFPIHFVLLGILLSFSLLGLGPILFFLTIIFESSCISYNILIFFKVFKFKGILYSLIYNLIIKGVYIILLLIIFKEIIKLSKILIKNNQEQNFNLNKHLKKIAFSSTLIIINDFLIYLFANKILLKLIFIIK